MKIDTLSKTLESISRESGVEKVVLFNSSGTQVCEKSIQSSGIINFEDMQGKIKKIIELSHDCSVSSEEMLISMGTYKVMINFLENGTLTLFCNDQADFPALGVSTRILSKKICRNLVEEKAGIDLDEESSKYEFVTMKARTNSFKKSDHPLSVILKKMLCESEGPVGSIIFKKSLRVSGVNSNYLDLSTAENLIEVIGQSVSMENSKAFTEKARKVTMEFFA